MFLGPLIPADTPGAMLRSLAAEHESTAGAEVSTESRERASAPADFSGELQVQLDGMERSLTRFTHALSRELTTLEHTLSKALQSFIAAIRRPATGLSSGSAATTPAAARNTPYASEETSEHGPPSRYRAIIDHAAQRHGVDPLLVSAVIRQESGFRADAVSAAGAVGLMQLMPGTAKDLGVADPFDPAANVDGGTRLLRSLLDRYDGRVDLALAAYNAGAGAVDRFHGVPPYTETQSYVRAIMARYRNDALAEG